MRVFYCLRAGAALARKFYIFLRYSFYFFQHIKYIQKGGYADAGKDDSNKRIAELQKMRRSDYAKTWIGRRRIKIEIEKIKKTMR